MTSADTFFYHVIAKQFLKKDQALWICGFGNNGLLSDLSGLGVSWIFYYTFIHVVYYLGGYVIRSLVRKFFPSHGTNRVPKHLEIHHIKTSELAFPLYTFVPVLGDFARKKGFARALSHNRFRFYFYAPSIFCVQYLLSLCESVELCGGFAPSLLKFVAFMVLLEFLVFFDHWYILVNLFFFAGLFKKRKKIWTPRGTHIFFFKNIYVYMVMLAICPYDYVHIKKKKHRWEWGKKNLNHHLHHSFELADEMTAWTGYAFEAVDGFSQGFPLVICQMVVPIPLSWYLALVVTIAMWTMYIHCGVPTICWPFMGADYHFIHHKYNWYNFGFFTMFFDWLFGTLKHPVPEDFVGDCRSEQKKEK
ncbi:hypothetical protein RFI_01047 [Reticulomyxa filosa]|uniref:Fatty acid hydroxylase domain-containing protein n=1 Tax=Reticulomyxa filosa TaxID=46433 RepID=X6PEA5_RETFI|nr:hypothetical protein RFI_01047 [Reticulomyxa filosa]|eukprot:ETO36017.1 hypothetical protein RFI_01047 [Reticulomyxa filosa]